MMDGELSPTVAKDSALLSLPRLLPVRVLVKTVGNVGELEGFRCDWEMAVVVTDGNMTHREKTNHRSPLHAK